MTDLDKVKQDTYSENPYKFLLIELMEACQDFTEKSGKILEQLLTKEEEEEKEN